MAQLPILVNFEVLAITKELFNFKAHNYEVQDNRYIFYITDHLNKYLVIDFPLQNVIYVKSLSQ